MRKLLFAAPFLLLAGLASASQASDDFVKKLWQIAPEREADSLDPGSVAFVHLMFGHQPDEEHQPKQDDPLLPGPAPKVQEPLEMPEVFAVPLGFEPPFVAGELCGLIVLISGLVGWIALGVAVLIVERKPTKPA